MGLTSERDGALLAAPRTTEVDSGRAMTGVTTAVDSLDMKRVEYMTAVVGTWSGFSDGGAADTASIAGIS